METNKVPEREFEILKAEDVASILRIGRVKAYELLKTGEIQSIKVGRRNIRTTKKALINYINGGGNSQEGDII